MVMKSITLELPDWANWIAQDWDGELWEYEKDPKNYGSYFNAEDNNDRMRRIPVELRGNSDWQNSKINLNTHGAYIDANGILRRCELIPDMLKPQAD